MLVRSSFDRRRVSITNFGQSMTVASEAPACEIQSILAAHVRGMSVNVNTREPQYLDCTSVEDFVTAQNKVIQARNAFDALPSRVRARFANDPLRLLEFVADKDNLKEAASLGLLSSDALERLAADDQIVTPPQGA